MLPSEASARLRRESLNLCQELTRVTLDCIRTLHNMITALSEGNASEAVSLFPRVSSLKDEATNLKRSLAEALISAGAILFSREDFLRLAVPLTEMCDGAEGVAFRLKEASSRKEFPEKQVLEAVRALSEGVLDCALKLRDVTYSLNFDISKVESLVTSVETSERQVDDLYRRAVIKLVYSKMEVPNLLLMRDVLEMLEEVADKAEDAADASRMLALSVL